jgi:hypothetical protein
VFKAYFDESGTHDGSPAVVVAGWLASANQWAHFSADWLRELRAFRLYPPVFHMTDFESRRQAFATWSNPERIRRLQRLQKIIRRRTRKAIAVAVAVDAYAVAREERKVPGELSAYGFAVMECTKKVGAWADLTGHKDPVGYCFEAGAKHQGDVVTAMTCVEKNPTFQARFRYGSWAFGFKQDLPPLQAADMLAYEVWKEMVNANLVDGGDRIRPRRLSLAAMSDVVVDFTHYNARTFALETPLDSE